MHAKLGYFVVTFPEIMQIHNSNHAKNSFKFWYKNTAQDTWKFYNTNF